MIDRFPQFMDEYIISLLGKVNYPGFSRDIVSFGLVREASLTGVKAFVKIELTSADPTIPQTLKQEIEKTLLESDKIKEVEVSIILKKGNSQSGHNEQENGYGHSMVKKIIAIASGKGGVGKSTVAVNLACALAKEKRDNDETLKIGLMDCDLYGPSVPLLIGTNEQPSMIEENLMAPVESYGVKVISMGLLVDEETPVVWRGPMVMKTIQQFAHNVKWDELDLLLIDLPPGTGDAQLSLAQILPLDGVVVVTTPQKAAMDVARRGARMFEKVEVPILGVVENMSFLMDENSQTKTFPFGQGGGAITAKSLNTVFLGEIPLHEDIRQGGDYGVPIVISNEESAPSEAIKTIGRNVLDLVNL
ncbi:MAG: Mrp/NBP35 family ATP-binding protein [Verrucomicrobiota bacterium]|nr:Mrp/NBP35 family ATP-binding protein [Verrucomicrobiota bacterium]